MVEARSRTAPLTLSFGRALSDERSRLRILVALRRKHIRALWIGLVLSAIGDTLYSIAVVWIAVKAVGGSAGIIAATQSTATLLLAPAGGVLADRKDRRRLMITADLLRAAVVATLPLAAYFAPIHLAHLITVAIALGALNAMFNPALQASLPSLSEGVEELQAMNALMDATLRIARAIGPSLAGLLAAAISIPHFFTIDAVSFIISALAVTSIARHFAHASEPVEHGAPGLIGLIHEVRGAIALVRSNRPMRYAFPGMVLINAAWCCGFTVGGALFASRVLEADVGAYGFIVGAYGAGNVLSNLVCGSLSPKNRVPMLFIGHVILGVGFIGLAIAPTLHWAMLASAIAATGGPVGSLALVTMIQTELPRAQIGKVFSLKMCAEYGGVSLGLLAAAPLFAILSVRTGIAACAVAMGAFGISGLLRFRSVDGKVPPRG